MKQSLKMLTLLGLSLCFLMFGAAQTARAATFTVDTTADNASLTACTDAPNDCSLRGAVSSAPAGSTINFSVTGTITLTGEIGIAKDLTIIGAASAPGITISGNNASRIFTVTSGTVNLSTLTLSGGNGRSGIVDSYNGAAVYNSGGTLTIANSTLSGNSNQYNGGAVFNKSNLTVVNSTFSGNISSGNAGGAIFSYNATLTVVSSTFSGNRSNSTGGGIWSSGTLDISNTIVAGNSGSSCPDLFSDSAPTGDYNLVQTADYTVFNAKCAAFSANHNITGQSASLGELTPANGGPTATMALLPGSFAVNSGDPNFDTAFNPYDQRGAGYPRKNSSAIDIGAFESALTTRPPVATNANLYFYLNTASSANLTVSSGDASGTLTYSIVSGTLPNGLALDPATGIISGTTTAYSTGTITFQATDGNGVQSNTATATINVVETPSLIVNTNSDTIANDGVTSLREAVAYANSGSAGANPVITFSVTGVIEVKEPTISISRDMTITGPGAGVLALSGNGNDGVSHHATSIFTIGGGTVGINGLTLRDGTGTAITAYDPSTGTNTSKSYGGALFMSGGTATISDSTLSGNFADFGGAVYARGGSLTITGSAISNNLLSAYKSGGGIYNEGGSVTLSNTTVSGNTAGVGAGILNTQGGTLNVSSSTVSGNTAQNYTGTVTIVCATYEQCQNPPAGFTCDFGTQTCTGTQSNNGRGAGIFNLSGTVNIKNSTVSGNRALGYDTTLGNYGGGVENRSMMTIANSTITANYGNYGGGILNRGTLNLSSAIVAGNTSSRDTPDIFNYPNSSTSGSYNLVQNGGAVTGTGNITGVDAKLGALANNGGATQTHALLDGSPAVDAGDPNFNQANTPYDQRGAGYPRVLNGRVDIGAYEGFVYQNNLVVNTLDDHDDGSCSQSDCTLREAVKYAAAAGATITFNVSGTITLTQGEIVLVKNVSINGPANAPGITISGNNQSRIFSVGTTSGANTLSLSNLTLTKGNGTGIATTGNGTGGAIFGSGTLNVANCTFTANTATGNGGAIRNSAALTIVNSTFYGNTATGNGGAIQFGSSGATVTNSTISGNTATGSGGGINNNAGTASTIPVTLSNSIVAGNSAATAPDFNGKFTAGDYNLIQNTSGATLVGTHNVTGQDPKLGALADNGGATKTMALLAGSPAINAGDPNFDAIATPYDQRGAGFARKVGSAIDIGAFEVQPAAAPTDLTVAKTHTGNFAQGDTGKTYTIAVTNGGGTASSGTVSVTDTLPAGLTATAISGTNWNCTLASLTCTRSDALAAGTSYPAITLTVNVAANASASVTNTAAVSGGGETNTANNTATDPTTINPTATYSISGQIIYGITPTGAAARGVPSVTLNASGTPSVTATSNSSGVYQLSGLGSGANTVVASKTGDVNHITANDALLVQQYGAYATDLTANQIVAADTNNDNLVNTNDALYIQQYLAYVGTATPNIIEQWKFLPGSRNYTLTSNQTNQNYTAVLVGDVDGDWVAPGGTNAPLRNAFAASESENAAPANKTNAGETNVNDINVNQIGTEKPRLDGQEAIKYASPSAPETAAAVSSVTVTLPTSATSSTGTSVTIPITVSQLPALADANVVKTYAFNVQYDATVLQFTGFDTTGTLSGNGVVCGQPPPDATNNRIVACNYTNLNGITGQGTLVKLNFTVIGTSGRQSALTFVGTTRQPNPFVFNTGDPQAATANGTFTVTAPTAAAVSIGGRVLSASGRGISGVRITLTDSSGDTKTVASTSFGDYRFDNVSAGSTYILTAKGKRYEFSQPTQVVNVNEDTFDINFTANSLNKDF